MRILGVDPGTIKCGYGIIDLAPGGKLLLVHFGLVNLASLPGIPQKLECIYSALSEQITKYHPNEFSIETAFYGKNVQSALKIGLARGAAILAARHHQLGISEYSPREIKKAVVGNGAASKEQVMFMVKTLLSSTIELRLDESDAIAAALCHAFRFRQGGETKQKSWKTFIDNFPERVIK